MADFDYDENPFEKVMEKARQQSEPSSDQIEMKMPSYTRRASPPPRRFPSQQTPLMPALPEPQPEPAAPVNQESAGPTEAASHEDDSAEYDREAEEQAERDEIEAEDAEAAEIAVQDVAENQHHVEDAEHERETDEHQEEVRAEEREDGDREIRDSSGGSGGSGASGSSPGTSAGASAPEAHPQRDEPDDGEHAESVAAEVEDPQPEQPEPESAPVPDPVTPEPLTDPPLPAEPTDVVTASAARVSPAAAAEDKKPWLASVGSQPMSYEREVHFNHEGETTILKKMSRPMIDQLRIKMATITGGDFADRISGASLITAFTAVKLGFPMEADENTAKAMRAFEMMEPRLDAIEEHAAEISRDIVMMADQMTKMNKKMLIMERSTRAIELVQSYAFTDRVLGGVDGANSTAESIRLNAPQAQQTRTELRREAESVIKLEQEREGRGIHRAGG